MKSNTLRRLLTALMIAALGMGALASCGDDGATEPTDTADDNNGGKADDDATEQRLCVGVRGNGPRIFAHFAAMARIHEHYGPISAVAGGSSGSITSFLTESAYANPHIHNCGGKVCDPDQQAARVALIFKSLEGYIQVLAQSEEAMAFQQLAPLAARLQAGDIDNLVAEGKIEEARQAILTILESDDVRALINPEVIALLTSSPNPAFHTQDLWAGVQNFGTFAVDSDRIFIRPGLIDFEAFAALIGRIGSFYAAYGPSDDTDWQAFMEGCAEPGRGMTWRQVQGLDAGNGQTCGALFGEMLTTWRAELVANEGSYDSRIDDPVGKFLPALISTSVLQGDAADTFRAARADYLAGKEYTWQIDFDDVRFGYWGAPEDLARVGDNPRGFKDAKTGKFLALGQDTWRKALSLSPAEPGLARALEIDDQLVSAGGWSDLAPVLVLENLGCDQVVLVTRQGDVHGFGSSVATLLGMDTTQDASLYDLTNPDSGVGRSLTEADGVWCTNWDGFGASDIAGVFDDSFNAPMAATDAFFTDGSGAYPNTKPSVDTIGCTFGIGPDPSGGE